MSARVLVVDDVLPNVRLLEAKLSSEYFDVLTATSGPAAIEAAEAEQPDIILLDVMMPGMDGFEVCQRLKADTRLSHIPIVMVTALSDVSDRVKGLEAGADDFLTKPVNDIALFARVRSLVRLKMMMDELRLREQTSSGLGVVGEAPEVDTLSDVDVLIVEDRQINARNMCEALPDEYRCTVVGGADDIGDLARSADFDLVIVSLSLSGTDGLRLCSQLRSIEETRQVPLLVLVDDSPHDMDRLVKGLDFGVNDYLIRPIDQNELVARATSQVRRKRYEDRLRQQYHLSLTMAVTDALTGLYNRRYVESHLDQLVQRANRGDKPVTVMMLDIDHFKPVNDTYGHQAGDEVLREFASRIGKAVRGIDMTARFGGEEFVVVLPDTLADQATVVAERQRVAICDEGFAVSGHDEPLNVTVSIGIAQWVDGDSADSLLRRADEALYAAKNAGRNRAIIAPLPIAETAEPAG